ncbi:MAG TPA: rhomboid family intramembrane serine protease [Bdellovibrionales bacterium]|nr:rhomboid family intramembrane serine protease [Bdellovibrionales bacterium]
MIFPILSGLISWRKAPVTWILFALNLLVWTYTTTIGASSQKGLEEMMRKKYFVSTQGRVYAQYLERSPAAAYPEFLHEMGRRSSEGATRAEALGQLAFRDLTFLRSADTMEYDGDQVAFRLWQKEIQAVRRLQDDHPSFTLGLNGEDTSFGKWVSYIFVHSGALHFFGNMLFLLIFGAALEAQTGGLGLLVVFLLSGLTAAGSFGLMTGVTSSPLVGASGAISGVMALYCVLNWGRPERYFYWLFLPFRGYMGFIYLPAWVAMLMWILGDLAGYFSSLAELGGVAYTAHLGGEAAGIVTGLILYSCRRFWPRPRETRPLDRVPLGTLVPLLPPRPIKAS